MFTTVKKQGAVALAHAKAIGYSLLAWAAWLLAAYERLLGALAGALVGSVEGFVKAVHSRQIAPPLAANGVSTPTSRPNGVLQAAPYSVHQPAPAARASPAKPTARPAAVTVTPLPAAPLSPASPAKVAFAEPVVAPAESQQEPGTPRPAARVSGKIGGDDASSTAPPSPAPSTVAPPAHPSPTTARLLSFPVVVNSSPSSVATTKAEEEEEEDEVEEEEEEEHEEEVKHSTRALAADEVPKLSAAPLKAAVPQVTAVAAEPVAAGAGTKGKKKRGPIRGPLHKATKEIKKVFGATGQ